MKITTRDMILVSFFTALTAVGAFLKIPISPAPITMQFLFTAFAGILLGSKLGALSQIIYVVLGLLGLPVFTKPSGLSYVFEPSFGYLIGFIFGAYVIGKISETNSKTSFIRLFLASVVGISVIYLIGVPYLYIILKYAMGTSITFGGALKSGLLIFLSGDITKCIVTAIIGVKVVPRVKHLVSGRNLVER
ncbi:biotin transporter BioY [Clostridium bovifaecis]|uniref:Biotin transporter n=1 Tax=Clostridium bovifaecis TaxID=2184719 RepID=A0A6I6F638_9CLOT|nr:biotin transporter BioY [Clostridium bovifaecis]